MNVRLLALVGAGGAVWYFWPTVSDALSSLGIPMPQPSGEAARDYIIAAFESAGLSTNLGRAAAVSAYAESRWIPTAAAPWPEDSVGWFQLNSAGLGRGYSLPRTGTDHGVDPADPRLLASTQCAAVIGACKASTVIMSSQSTASVRALTSLFTTQVEKPADAAARAAERVALVGTLFPGVE
jgi:hypothetical protein